MSDKAKKKWSTKKKLLVILLPIVILLVLIVSGGVAALNWYCQVSDYELVELGEVADENTVLIAHRGYRAVAPENTLPAFEMAGENDFWGAECDIYRTADGVWVVQHDFNTYRMMDCIKNIESSTYEELLEHNTDNGNNIEEYPNLKICTLEEYLECCEKYSMTAVIELKGKNNTEHYDEIIASIEKYDVDVLFISFKEENLRKLREITDLPLMYLTYVVDDEAIAIAKEIGNCGIDFDGNKEENYENDAQFIKKAQDEGLELGAWTIDDKETAQKLLNLGVNYITTDCITY